MDRREFLRQVALQSTALLGSYLLLSCRPKDTTIPQSSLDVTPPTSDDATTLVEENPSYEDVNSQPHGDQGHRNLDQPFEGDIYLDPAKEAVFQSTLHKLTRLIAVVGYGRFNIISFDDALRLGRNAGGLEPFTRDELDFIAELFARDPKAYGFYGDLVTSSLTAQLPAKELIKVPHTGHYLFREQHESIYQRIQKDIGNSLILTSGVRGVVKQIHLFLAKAESVGGNLSQTSRSLAPPGYSYHAVGDFDVGKKGLGNLNFTDKFSQTDEFKKLQDLGYIDIRYPENNPFGVRFEPWHIEGVKRDQDGCPRCG